MTRPSPEAVVLVIGLAALLGLTVWVVAYMEHVVNVQYGVTPSWP